MLTDRHRQDRNRHRVPSRPLDMLLATLLVAWNPADRIRAAEPPVVNPSQVSAIEAPVRPPSDGASQSAPAPASSAPATQSAPVPVSVSPRHAEQMKAGLALFRTQVRSLLIKSCFDCHGGKSVKGEFDLTTRELLVESGAIDGEPDETRFMALVTHAEEPGMPFKQPKLSDEAIAALRQWLTLGAPYDQPLQAIGGEPRPLVVTDQDREFWSFRPLSRPAVPKVADAAWGASEIDAFIRAKQQEHGLTPNSQADRRTLMRRARFDLLGLPPTPEELAAFIADPSPDAYAGLIDRLLASPYYGERWARHWMDVARFAESHGYEQDYDRPTAYHYRDFLIQAFNRDLPFDQFAKWQLAGDELAPHEPLALMATGFLGGGSFPTQLTEVEFESARYDELDDMTATTGVAFLGLSIGCARCHDHKYDPLPARDYYNMAAAFTTTIRGEVELDLQPDENRQRQAQFDKQLAAATAELQTYERDVLPSLLRERLHAAPIAEAAAEDDAKSSKWVSLANEKVASSAGTRFERLPDGSWLATGPVPAQDTLTVTGVSHRSKIRAVRLEALTHPSLPHQGPGRASNGNFALTHFSVSAAPQPGEQPGTLGTPGTAVPLASATATHQQDAAGLSVAAAIDADPATGWAVDRGGIGHDQAAVFFTRDPVDAGGQLTITLTFKHPNPQHSLGRFRLSVTDREQAAAEVGAPGPDGALIAALRELQASGESSGLAWDRALKQLGPTQSDWRRLAETVEQLRKAGPELVRNKVLICSEGLPHLPHHADGRGFPHFYPETFVLKRGDVHQKQGLATVGFPQVLQRSDRGSEHWIIAPPTGSRTSFRRASLANWLTDAEAGAGALAARVIVNRVWQHHLGRGIVATPNDFGAAGDRPSHPELLEWLASDFVEHGWQLKRLHKQIMTSATYRQSALHDEARSRIDRENVWLWRRTPRRLEGEAIRDSLLSVAGRLDSRMFGPGTLDANMQRRSVYFFVKRSQLIPMMMLFDWPEHLVSIGQRGSTTVAPQALMFMNSEQGRQYAAGLAAQLPSGDGEAAVRRAYQLTLGRDPQLFESNKAREFLRLQTEAYRAAQVGQPERSALTDFCQALFGMNEFIYID